jgi:hypothetical protein
MNFEKFQDKLTYFVEYKMLQSTAALKSSNLGKTLNETLDEETEYHFLLHFKELKNWKFQDFSHFFKFKGL